MCFFLHLAKISISCSTSLKDLDIFCPFGLLRIWWEKLLKASVFCIYPDSEIRRTCWPVCWFCVMLGRILHASFVMQCMWLSNRFNHELVFGVSVKNMNKAERLIFGDSMMTHAMVLTAVSEKVESASWNSDVCTDVFEQIVCVLGSLSV